MKKKYKQSILVCRIKKGDLGVNEQGSIKLGSLNDGSRMGRGTERAFNRMGMYRCG